MNQKGSVNLVLIGIVSLLVIAGGYFLWKEKTKKVETSPSTEISNWKTYTDSDYGFEFKYPPNAEIIHQKQNDIQYGVVAIADKVDTRKFYFSLYVNSSGMGFESLAVISQNTIIVDGVKVNRDTYEVVDEHGEGKLRVWFSFDKNGNHYDVIADSYFQANQILSTFKFTK